MSALEGRQISHYRILHRVGSGGMGVVYGASEALTVAPEHLASLGVAVGTVAFMSPESR